jgi:hypothetical protein
MSRDLGKPPTSLHTSDGTWTIHAVSSRDLDGPHPDTASTGSGTGSGAFDDVVIDMLELQDQMGEGRRL